MLDKLKEDYERSQRDKNRGHAIGFYNELNEQVNKIYEFEDKKFGKGKFILKLSSDNFFWWNYDAIVQI